MILFIDKPVQAGDFCAFGGMKGTVESIGMRSTEVRALDRTIVSIPNSKFVDMELINYARCDRMLIDTRIGLRYETGSDQLRFILAKMREMFHAHPKIERDTVRVRFAGYGEASLQVAIRVYVLTQDWNEFFAVREDVLLRVGDIVKEAGSRFALPAQTLFLGRDAGIDGERGEVAGEAVAAWREAGELPFPRFPAERIDALQGTLDYPPRGSFEAEDRDFRGGTEKEPLAKSGPGEASR